MASFLEEIGFSKKQKRHPHLAQAPAKLQRVAGGDAFVLSDWCRPPLGDTRRVTLSGLVTTYAMTVPGSSRCNKDNIFFETAILLISLNALFTRTVARYDAHYEITVSLGTEFVRRTKMFCQTEGKRGL
jgi:hypothetical protein